jgi:hypothetical protein
LQSFQYLSCLPNIADEDNDEDSDEEEDESDEADGDEFGEQNEYDAIVAAEKLPDDEEKDRQRERPALLLILLLCCCFLLLVGLAVGLGVGLSKSKDDEVGTMSPSAAPSALGIPSAMPSLSSFSPTNNGDTSGDNGAGVLPEGEVTERPDGDNTIFTEGPDSEVSQGGEEALRVGNGDPNDENNPPSYIIMRFNWNETGYPWFNVEDLQGYTVAAELCVTHIANSEEDGTVTYSACRLPGTVDDIETLTGSTSPYVIPDDCLANSVTVFNVAQSTEDIYCLDVTSAVVNFPPFASTTGPDTRKLRNRLFRTRLLQENVFDEYQNIIFVIANLNDSPPATDQFHSRSSGDLGPQLTLDVQLLVGDGGGGGGDGVNDGDGGDGDGVNDGDGGDGDGVNDGGDGDGVNDGDGGDGGGGNETSAPLASETPRPTEPTTAPSVSDAPSSSEAPTATPSLSAAPSLSAPPSTSFNPTFGVVNEACGVCGFNSGDPILSIPIALNGTFRPNEYEEDTILCDELNQLCLDGFCSTEVCQAMPLISEVCGCQVANFTEADNRVNCNVCGEGNEMNELFAFVTLSTGLGPPGWSDRVVCDRIERGCNTGFCTQEMCNQIPLDIAETCACSCNACGAGFSMIDPNATIIVPDGVVFPGLNATNVTCSEIQQLCDDGFCHQGNLCSTLPSLIESVCGCVNTTSVD